MVSGPGWGIEAMMAVYRGDDAWLAGCKLSPVTVTKRWATHAITTFPLESTLSRAGCSLTRATDKRTDGGIKKRCNGDATLFAVVMEMGRG